MQIPASQAAGTLSSRAQSSIVFGFAAIAALFFTIVVIWLAMLSSHNTNIQQINLSESQRQLIFTMRDAAYQRSLALFRMAALKDAFERDSEYLQFKAAAVRFIVARRQLLKSQLPGETTKGWLRLRPRIQQSEKLQNAIVDLISEEQNAAALDLIQSRFIPLQREVSQQLTKMLNAARNNIERNMTTASATTKTQYQWILLLILVATGIGYAIANTVLRRSREAETVLLNKNRQIRAFTQITSDSRKTIEEQLDDILQLGCRLLAMKCGLLLRVEACGSASVLIRYCADHLGGAVFQQAMIDRLSAAAKNTSDAVLATDTLNDRDPELADLLNREHIKTLITSTVCNAGPVSAVVIFMHNKTITADNEINDLTQLIGNKLAVLLDQQETLSQLQNARQAAETANKTRNTFLNHITYKLQTALNAIIGHNELLQEQMRRHNHPQYLNDSNKIGTESRQLLAWISNLLDLTQIETGNMVFTRQRFDIGLVLEQTVKNLEVIATETEHHLQMPRLNDLGPMVGDAAKITRILTSIISFCCSLYGHKKIYLTVWREHDPQVDWLYVEVYKNGSGMSKKRINQLFKLATADSLDREKTVFNAQLDLAISKKLCERLGGDILVDSKPGGGTTFTVCLPCRSLQLNEVGLEAAGSN